MITLTFLNCKHRLLKHGGKTKGNAITTEAVGYIFTTRWIHSILKQYKSLVVSFFEGKTLRIYLEAGGLEKQMKGEIGKFYAMLKRTDDSHMMNL